MKWDPLVLICSDILKTSRVASNPNYIVISIQYYHSEVHYMFVSLEFTVKSGGETNHIRKAKKR